MIDQAAIDLIVKVLGMTGSVHDGEALAAIRKANDLLKRAGVSWRDVIALPQVPARPPGSVFRDWQREHERQQHGQSEWPSAYRSPTREELERDLQVEKEKILAANARQRLDDLLARGVADPLRRQHFESIRENHRRTGHINPAHRAQIDRAFFKRGWDRPLDDPNEKANLSGIKPDSLFDDFQKDDEV